MHFRGTRHCRFRRKDSGEGTGTAEEGDCYRPKITARRSAGETRRDYHGAATSLTRRRTNGRRSSRGWDPQRNAAPEDPWRNSRGLDASSSSILTRSSRRRSHNALGVKSVSLSLLLSDARARAHTSTFSELSARSLTHSRSLVRPSALTLSRERVGETRAHAQALTNTINPL